MGHFKAIVYHVVAALVAVWDSAVALVVVMRSVLVANVVAALALFIHITKNKIKLY